MFHSLTNLGVVPEDFLFEGKSPLTTHMSPIHQDFTSVANSQFFFTNFSITQHCSDLETVSKSEFLLFFCLYCPIQKYSDHVYFKTLEEEAKYHENKENWNSENQKIAEINFPMTNNKLKIGGVRNFFIKLNRKENKENDKFLSFKFKFKNNNFLYCVPNADKAFDLFNLFSWFSTYFVGERYFRCDDDPDNCFCESYFNISIFHHLNFLTSLSLSISLPFLICLGCCCGFFPQLVGCCFHPKHLCTNFKLYSFIFWFLGTCLSFSYNFGLFWFSFESYWEWNPYIINVFDSKDENIRNSMRIPDLEGKIAHLFPLESKFWPSIWRYDTIKFIFSIVPFANYLTWFCTFFSFVSLVFHLFFLTSLFEQYTKENRRARRMIVQILLFSFLSLFVIVNVSCFCLRVVMEIFIFFSMTDSPIYEILDTIFHFIFDCGGVFLVSLVLGLKFHFLFFIFSNFLKNFSCF